MNLTEDDPLTETKLLEQVKHTHFIIREGRKITNWCNDEEWFSYIECGCGLTGVNENGETLWNESNYSKRLGRMVSLRNDHFPYEG